MNKLICGLIQTTLSPFIIIFGYFLISKFHVSKEAMIFASIMGGISIVFNFCIGCALIIRGYQDLNTFEGWKAP